MAQHPKKINLPGFRRQKREEYLLNNFKIIRSTLTLNIKKSIVSKTYVGRNFVFRPADSLSSFDQQYFKEAYFYIV